MTFLMFGLDTPRKEDRHAFHLKNPVAAHSVQELRVYFGAD